MDSYSGLGRRRYKDHGFVWDKRFAERQEKAYTAERMSLIPGNDGSMISTCINQVPSRLDPPQYNYSALRDFLDQASENDLRTAPTPIQHARNIILLDDRRDNSGWHDVGGHRHLARDWSSYAHGYPPPGENIQCMMLNPGDLYRKLLTKKLECGSERRILYICDMSSICGLALISTLPQYQAPVLRDFMQRYISYRPFFGVSMSFGFSLEFHLPYYALRQHLQVRKDSRLLRRCGRFIKDPKRPAVLEYLYEAQISMAIVGIDEWVWTAYVCTETYFGSEESIQHYHENDLDAPSGGLRDRYFPVWNPREYFLFILSLRLKQVTQEWGNIVDALEKRLQHHEKSIFNEDDGEPSLTDNPSFDRTREYTKTIDLLRLLHNALARFIESWQNFEGGEIQYFEGAEHEALRKLWDGYLAQINKNMAELRFMRTTLRQRIELFDNKRSGLVNASQLVESRVATLQGKDIGRLTRVTVVYLPLSLGTAIFGMAIMPKEASWLVYSLLILFLTSFTLSMAFREYLVKGAQSVWKSWSHHHDNTDSWAFGL